MKTFVTSDTHFGHANIIKYCNRPFVNWQAMGDALIERWNSRVGKCDTVWFLGDFAMGPGATEDYVVSVINRLNGCKQAVAGNHDAPTKYSIGLLGILLKYHITNFEIFDDSIIQTHIDGKRFVMCHYPLEDWNGKYHGAVHLHGHTHKTNLLDLNKFGGPPDPTCQTEDPLEIVRCLNDDVVNRYDVGVDMYGGPVEITGDLRYLNNPKGWA